jgi:hypothetical protein
MMQIPPGAPLSMRMGARVGPEVIASVLVALVVIVGATVALSGRQASAGAGPLPSVAAVVPGSPGASSLPSASTTPFAAVPARAVVDIVDHMLVQRAGLQAELAKKTTNVATIAELLRQVNASIVSLDGPLTKLAEDPSTLGLTNRIREVKTATFEAARRTQQAGLRNQKAYRDGATEVVAQLAPLPAIRAELAALVG